MKLLVNGEEVECSVVAVNGWVVDRDGNYHEFHSDEEAQQIFAALDDETVGN